MSGSLNWSPSSTILLAPPINLLAPQMSLFRHKTNSNQLPVCLPCAHRLWIQSGTAPGVCLLLLLLLCQQMYSHWLRNWWWSNSDWHSLNLAAVVDWMTLLHSKMLKYSLFRDCPEKRHQHLLRSLQDKGITNHLAQQHFYSRAPQQPRWLC